MTLKELIKKYNIKQSYIMRKMDVSKAGLHMFLNKGMSIERSNQIRTVLFEYASGILEDLKKSS